MTCINSARLKKACTLEWVLRIYTVKWFGLLQPRLGHAPQLHFFCMHDSEVKGVLESECS